MDVDFWSSRVIPYKYLSAVQAGLIHPDNHILMDDSDGDDEARACFSCPFCYVDIEMPLLCTHLQEEHCFDFKNSVCPLCAANLGKDVLGHFIIHHPNSLKRMKKPEKSTASAMHSKKLQAKGRESKNEASPDPLLSPFICSVPFSDLNEIPKQEISTNKFTSITASSMEENREENAEKRQRTEFIQQLITSTISWSISESQHF